MRCGAVRFVLVDVHEMAINRHKKKNYGNRITLSSQFWKFKCSTINPKCLETAVCILPLVYILPSVCTLLLGLQAAICSLQSSFSRYEKMRETKTTDFIEILVGLWAVYEVISILQ